MKTENIKKLIQNINKITFIWFHLTIILFQVTKGFFVKEKIIIKKECNMGFKQHDMSE